MHAVVLESLEEYLSGSMGADARRAIEAHLGTCAECRDEVRAMQEVSRMFSVLRSEDAVEPAPGFYARVMDEIETRRAPSFASFFSLDLAFGRRVVFASLITLALLGSYLASRETNYNMAPTPEYIIAREDASMLADGPGERGRMLVTLVSYEQ